jgi:hypothetical protein
VGKYNLMDGQMYLEIQFPLANPPLHYNQFELSRVESQAWLLVHLRAITELI